MADKKRLLKNQGTELESITGNINCVAEAENGEGSRTAQIQANQIMHNEQETKLSAVDAKMKNTKQGTRAEFTSVSAAAKHDTKEVNVNVTKIAVEKDRNGGNAKAVVTAANITKNAQGNTRLTAITNAGAGQSVNIPSKEKGVNLKITHEATIITEDEQGQQVFSVFRVSAYSQRMMNEKRFAWKNVEKLLRKIPKHPVLDFCKHLSLLIFFVFLFLYPLISFLVNREYIVLNVISLVIGAIGFAEEVYGIDTLFINIRKLCAYYKCCDRCGCSCCKSEDINTADREDDETCKCKKTINTFCTTIIDKRFNSSIPRKLVSTSMKITLVYAGLICALMGFINEQSWKLKSISSYVDCFLLLYSIIVEALLPRFIDLRWLHDTTRLLQTEYYNIRKMNMSECDSLCKRYLSPLGLAPIFGFLILILHLLMLGCIAARIYADNFFTMDNSTMNMTKFPEQINQTDDMESNVGMYKVFGFTWFMILGGIAVPFLSIITYFIINQYWVWEPLHYTGSHVPGGLSKQTRSYVESMSTSTKLIIYGFDPIAWIFMALLLGFFITFAVFSVVTGQEGKFPDFINVIYSICNVAIFPIFIVANIQAVLFGMMVYYLGPCCCLIIFCYRSR